MMKGRETFYGDHTVVVKFNMFDKMVILWKQGLHQRTENCRVYEFVKFVFAVLIAFLYSASVCGLGGLCSVTVVSGVLVKVARGRRGSGCWRPIAHRKK